MLFLALLSTAFSLAASSPHLSAKIQIAADPVVRLKGGSKVTGFIDQANPSVQQFLGVSFAAAPVGSLRFAPPQPVPLQDKPINATGPAYACPQFDPYSLGGGGNFSATPVEFANTSPVSEDCLTVSIWSPVSAATNTSGPLPVLIFIYGGGFLLGSSSVPYQNPTKWIQRTQNLIVVEMNYRMNIFGFPNAAGLDSQNLGLLDQRLAIEWVRDNIASFGGDPSQMALWGQSAGAASVDLYNYAHSEDPIVKGLIMDSGSAGIIQSGDGTHSNFTYVASLVGCGNLTATVELACMRNVSMQNILNAFTSALGKVNFGPVPDEKVVFGNVTARALAGKTAKIPAIVGSNADEDGLTGPTGGGALSLTCGALDTSRLRANANRTTFRYYFAGNFTNVTPNGAGAVHSSELPLVFGTHQSFRGNSTLFEFAVSEAMQDSWYKFLSRNEAGLASASWLPYTISQPNVRAFGLNGTTTAITLQGNPLDKTCKTLTFWSRLSR